MVPGDAPKSLSQHYRTIPGRVVCVWRERGEEKREEQKEVQRDGGEERSFEPLPPVASPPSRQSRSCELG